MNLFKKKKNSNEMNFSKNYENNIIQMKYSNVFFSILSIFFVIFMLDL